MRSIIYSNTKLYNLTMRLLYLGSYQERFNKIASEVGFGESVLELCFGDLYLFENYLKTKNIKYLGFDINPNFISHAEKKKANVILADIMIEPFPIVDTVIMQSSMYQFINDDEKLLKRMFEAARKKVIVAEPVRNLAQSKNKIISFLAKNFVNAGTGQNGLRYEKESFFLLFDKFIKDNFELIDSFKYQEIKGGREIIAVIKK